MYNETVKHGRDLNMVKTYVHGLHEHLHNVGGWHTFLNELKFNTDESSDMEEQTKKSANNNIELKSLEPAASTSKHSNVVKSSKPSEPMPITSKKAMKLTRPISNTTKSADLMPSKKSDSMPAAKAKKTNSASAKKADSASAKEATSAPKTPQNIKTTLKRKPSQTNATNPKRPLPDLEKRQVISYKNNFN